MSDKKEKKSEDIISELLNFVNSNLKPQKNDKDNLEEIEKLSKFIGKNNLALTQEELELIIQQSNILSSILEMIFSNGKIQQEQQVMKLTNEDEFITLLIGLFYISKGKDDYFSLEEEKELPISLKEFDCYKHLPKALTPQEEYRLGKLVQTEDKDAIEKLIVSNIRLVMLIARGYIGRGMDFEDLVQEGIFGLSEAATRFDPNKAKFSTYATYRIKQAIYSALSKNRTIRLPNDIYSLTRRIGYARNQLMQKLNREPTNEEIAHELDITPAKLEIILSRVQSTISYDFLVQPQGENSGEPTKMSNFIQTPHIGDDPNEIEESSDKKRIIKLLIGTTKLNENEKDVIEMYFGFNNVEKATLEEIANILGMTKERIRQLKESALQKIILNPIVYRLCDYNDNPTKARRRILSIQECCKLSPKSYKSISKIETMTIYERLTKQGYSKEQISLAVSRLSPQEQQILEKLNNSNIDSISEEEFADYLENVVPKLKKQLKRISKKGKNSIGDNDNTPQNTIIIVGIKQFPSQTYTGNKPKRLSRKIRYL